MPTEGDLVQSATGRWEKGRGRAAYVRLRLRVKGTRAARVFGIRRLFRDGIQFCSGLVDLVVDVGGHLGGAHCLALVRERFVGLVAEGSAQVGCGGEKFGER